MERAVRESGDSLDKLIDKVQTADSTRTIHILRQLGLVTIDSGRVCQLSVGAGPGNRDIDAMHAVPKITISNEPNAVTSSQSSRQLLSLDTMTRHPREAVLIDNDEEFRDRYDFLNKSSSENMRLLALIDDLSTALEYLPEKLEALSMQKINMVVGFRIDHRMLPRVADFFRRLSDLIDNQSDLILTIGAGHSLDEFIGREKKLDEITTFLRRRNLKPVRVRLCVGNSPEARRTNPSFSIGPITSYEILYCKLKNSNLLSR